MGIKMYYLAIDIGASSGRHIIGYLENGEIKTDEVFRFKNGIKKQENTLVWDVEELFINVKEGIKKAFLKYKNIKSLAIDTWGVDYVLMQGDTPILPCVSYRDSRTEKSSEEVHKIYPFEKLYKKTGISFNTFNTIYQLYADKLSGKLKFATDFLMMPEYLTYCLTGIKAKEYTIASTTGLLNVETGDFDYDIIEALGLPKNIFSTPKPTGSVVGNLKEEIAKEVGGQLQVILCASHDTASAVEGIPIKGDNPYISSGTWSLLGIKNQKAITTEESRKANYTNEGGVGYFRYLKNIMGMWIVNSLKAELCPEQDFAYIINKAKESTFNGVVDITENRFLSPQSMKAEFYNSFNEKPTNLGDYFKSALLSLAHSYKKALEELSLNTAKKFTTLYIVGGGAKNTYLNQLTEEICNVKVVALPIEATALGNLKIQIERKI